MSLTPPPIIHSYQVILALGFRPFFLAAGLSAIVSLALWLAMRRGWMPMNSYYAGTTWHAHELLFGYATAAIAGFLLTATRNWTGIATASGVQLAGLVLLWMAGRIAPFLPLPGALVAALDLSFPAAVALSLFAPLWRGPNPANRVFVIPLGSMSLASMLVHVEALGIAARTALAADRLMLGLILLTLLIVAGRIMPFCAAEPGGGGAGVRPLALACCLPALADAFRRSVAPDLWALFMGSCSHADQSAGRRAAGLTELVSGADR